MSWHCWRGLKRLELNDHRHNLQQIVAERTGELETAVSLLHKTLEQTIGALAAALEKRDPYTAGHQRRVAAIAKSIATAMSLDESTIESIAKRVRTTSQITGS